MSSHNGDDEEQKPEEREPRTLSKDYIESARKMRRQSTLVGHAAKKPCLLPAECGSPSLAEGQLWVYELVAIRISRRGPNDLG